MKNADAIVIKSVTVLIYSTLALLVLSFSVALLLPVLMDPSNYKTYVIDVVQEKTGRKLALAGNIHMDLFPRLEVTLEQVSLGNASGFGPDAMVKIQKVHGKFRWMDVLKRQFSVYGLFAEGVHIALERNVVGENNWDDLISRMVALENITPLNEQENQPDPETKISLAQLGAIALSALSTLSTHGITLRESTIRLCEPDASIPTVPSCITTSHLEIVTGPANSGKPMTLTLETDLVAQSPPFSGHVALKIHHRPFRKNEPIIQWQDAQITIRGQAGLSPPKELELTWNSDISVGPDLRIVRVKRSDSKLTVWSDTSFLRVFVLTLKGALEANLHTGQVQLPQGGLAWHVKSDYLPPAGIALVFQSPIEADWREETLRMASLRATGPARVRMEGQLWGSQLLTRPSLDAQLNLSPFDPRALLVALGQQVPATTDPKAISDAEFSAKIHWDERQLAVSQMVLKVDESTFSGGFRISPEAISGMAKPVIRFDLQGDSVNLDRYLSSTLKAQEQAKKMVLATVAPEIFFPLVPANLLRTLDLQGVLRLGKLRVALRQATDLSLKIAVNNGQLQLHPYRLTIYGGHIDTHASLGLCDTQGGEPFMTVDKIMTGVQVEPLLRETIDVGWPGGFGWGGHADLTTHFMSRGQQPDTLWKNLNGTMALTVNEGSIQGVNLVDRIRENYSAFVERRSFAANILGEGATHFSKLTATGTITNGVLENNDLLAFSPNLKVMGGGRVDLTRAFVDYALEVDVLTSLREKVSTQHFEGLEGLLLPIHIQGDVDTLEVPSISTQDFVFAPTHRQETPSFDGGNDIQKQDHPQGNKDSMGHRLKRLLGVEK